MPKLLQRMTLRQVWRHGGQTGLALLGVALGVGVVVAVDLANESARRGFEMSLESATGDATHHIVGPATGFDENDYRDLRLDLGVHRSSPVVEGFVTAGQTTLRLLGIDPLATPGDGVGRPTGEEATELMRRPGAVLLSRNDAARLGLERGDTFTVQFEGKPRRLLVSGWLAGSAGESSGLMLADIATAQEVLGRVGRLDRIDLVLGGAGEAERVSRWLPADLSLITTRGLGDRSRHMSEVFQQNLAAMSLLALVVGAFLIYNTMLFSVLRRRRQIGTLRMLGVTRRGVFALILAEAAVVGLVGTLLGLGLGIVLARELVGFVTRTINDLFFVLAVTDISPGVWPVLKSIMLGMGITMIAAWLPAVEAAAVGPLEARRRSGLEGRVGRALPLMAAAGLLLALAGAALLVITERGLTSGFGALLLIIVGFSLAVPLGVKGLASIVGRLFASRWHGLGRLSARALAAGLSRSGVAAAALAIAVSAIVGVGVMITSFRSTVELWLNQTLQSDIYVSAPSSVSSPVGGTLDRRIVRRAGLVEGVADVRRIRRVEAQTPYGPIDLLALETGKNAARGFRFKSSVGGSPWQRLGQGAVLISEPLAWRSGLSAGDRLSLTTAAGPREFPVAGIFYDYGSPQGLVVMSLANYRAWWKDYGISSLGLTSKAGVSLTAVLGRLNSALKPVGQAISVTPNREIRRLSLAVFDQTFAITHVLRLLTVGVAFVGILSALMALQLERAREHAILRATGVTPRELFAVVSLETGLLGLAAGLLALPLGLVMAEILIGVINRRSFGWSMQTVVPGGVLVEALLIALSAALLAGLYPAWRISRSSPAAALREE